MDNIEEKLKAKDIFEGPSSIETKLKYKELIISNIDILIGTILIKFNPLREKYSKLETSHEEELDFLAIRDRISDLKTLKIDIENLYINRDFSNNLSTLVSSADSLVKKFSALD